MVYFAEVLATTADKLSNYFCFVHTNNNHMNDICKINK